MEGNGKMSLRRPKLSTIKGSSAPRRRRRRRETFMCMINVIKICLPVRNEI